MREREEEEELSRPRRRGGDEVRVAVMGYRFLALWWYSFYLTI